MMAVPPILCLLSMLYCTSIINIVGLFIRHIVTYISHIFTFGRQFQGHLRRVNFFFLGLPAQPTYLPGVPGRNSGSPLGSAVLYPNVENSE